MVNGVARGSRLPFSLLVMGCTYGLLAYASLFGQIHYRLFEYLWVSELGWALVFLVMGLGLVRRWFFVLYVGKYAGLLGGAVMIVSAIAALLAPQEVVVTMFRHELAGYPAALMAALMAVYCYWQYKVLAWHELVTVLKLG